MKLTEIRDFLRSNGYVLEDAAGNYSFSAAFYRDLLRDTRGELSSQLSPTGKLLTETELYKQFLQDAKVPRISHTRDNKAYITGAFTKSGAKKLQEILQKGYKYDILCQAVAYYYEQTDFSTKVETLLKEDSWMTYYDMIREAGTARALPKKLSVSDFTNKTLR